MDWLALPVEITHLIFAKVLFSHLESNELRYYNPHFKKDENGRVMFLGMDCTNDETLFPLWAMKMVCKRWYSIINHPSFDAYCCFLLPQPEQLSNEKFSKIMRCFGLLKNQTILNNFHGCEILEKNNIIQHILIPDEEPIVLLYTMYLSSWVHDTEALMNNDVIYYFTGLLAHYINIIPEVVLFLAKTIPLVTFILCYPTIYADENRLNIFVHDLIPSSLNTLTSMNVKGKIILNATTPTWPTARIYENNAFITVDNAIILQCLHDAHHKHYSLDMCVSKVKRIVSIFLSIGIFHNSDNLIILLQKCYQIVLNKEIVCVDDEFVWELCILGCFYLKIGFSRITYNDLSFGLFEQFLAILPSIDYCAVVCLELPRFDTYNVLRHFLYKSIINNSSTSLELLSHVIKLSDVPSSLLFWMLGLKTEENFPCKTPIVSWLQHASIPLNIYYNPSRNNRVKKIVQFASQFWSDPFTQCYEESTELAYSDSRRLRMLVSPKYLEHILVLLVYGAFPIRSFAQICYRYKKNFFYQIRCKHIRTAVYKAIIQAAEHMDDSFSWIFLYYIFYDKRIFHEYESYPGDPKSYSDLFKNPNRSLLTFSHIHDIIIINRMCVRALPYQNYMGNVFTMMKEIQEIMDHTQEYHYNTVMQNVDAGLVNFDTFYEHVTDLIFIYDLTEVYKVLSDAINQKVVFEKINREYCD